MNPDSLFRQGLESHEFRSSDKCLLKVIDSYFCNLFLLCPIRQTYWTFLITAE